MSFHSLASPFLSTVQLECLSSSSVGNCDAAYVGDGRSLHTADGSFSKHKLAHGVLNNTNIGCAPVNGIHQLSTNVRL